MIADGGIIHDASGLRACCVLPGRKIMPSELFFLHDFFFVSPAAHPYPLLASGTHFPF